jgi:hypothetical protein
MQDTTLMHLAVLYTVEVHDRQLDSPIRRGNANQPTLVRSHVPADGHDVPSLHHHMVEDMPAIREGRQKLRTLRGPRNTCLHD